MKPANLYLIHRTPAKDRAAGLKAALEAAGHTVWYDSERIVGGDDAIDRMQDGLAKAHGAVLLITEDASVQERWAWLEIKTFLTRVVDEEHGDPPPFLIVVVQGRPEVPHVLRSLHQVEWQEGGGHEHRLREAVAIHMGWPRDAAPPLRALLRPPLLREAEVRLAWDGARLTSTLTVGEVVSTVTAPLSASALGELRLAAPEGAVRDPSPSAVGQRLARLGESLGALWAGLPLAAAVAPTGDGPALLRLVGDDAAVGLPWEAAWVGGQPLGLTPRLGLCREVDVKGRESGMIPGPLRLLVALAAPEGDLDLERESAVVLDAVEAISPLGAQVVFADESKATLDAIRAHLTAAPFHVLHLSAHGQPGLLQLEGDLGDPVVVEPAALAKALMERAQPPPLVVLSACSSGADAGDRAQVARALVAAGVPAVIAMQAPVSDAYAAELARHLYAALAQATDPVPALALGEARRAVEAARQEASRQGRPCAFAAPEYATAALIVGAGQARRPLLDPRAGDERLPRAPALVGVPGLALRPLGYFVGRRRRRREVLRACIEGKGAVLWGQGGMGKSSLAAASAAVLRQLGWAVAVVVGRPTVAEVAREVAAALAGQVDAASLVGLRDANRPEREQIQALAALVAPHRLLVLLDNLEDAADLTVGPLGLTGRDRMVLQRDVADLVHGLVAGARAGAVLITCRYGLADVTLAEVEPVAGLRPAEARRFLQRLPSFRDAGAPERQAALEVLGTHPRVLELADALARERGEPGEVVLAEVRARVERLAERGDVEVDGLTSAPERWAAARALAATDVLAADLLARLNADERALARQLAVYRRPVPEEAVGPRAAPTLARLVRLGLAEQHPAWLRPLEPPVVYERTWLVSRWLAPVVLEGGDAAACHAAAAAWWLAPPSVPVDEMVEVLEHHLAAADWAQAEAVGAGLVQHSEQYGGAALGLAVCDRMAEALPGERERQLQFDLTAVSFLGALGAMEPAVTRAEKIERAARAAGRERDLSVSLNKLGDLYQALGDGQRALEAFQRGYDIANALALREPGRADLQRDLSVSLERLGDLYKALGDGQRALDAFQTGYDIRNALALREPGRADLQRDLSVSLNKLGDLYQALGDGQRALEAFQRGYDIANALALREPGRADLQRDLSVSLDRLGDLYQALGDGQRALEAFQRGYDIANALALREPGRADLQRDLSVSLDRLGDLYQALGDGQRALEAFQRGYDIRNALALREPGRADRQRDLSVSLDRLGDLYQALGDGQRALDAFQRGYDIANALALREPGRADLQRDLSVSLNKLGDLYKALGDGQRALDAFQRGYDIRNALALREPGRADRQRDLSVSLERLGDLYKALGDGQRALDAFQTGYDIRNALALREPGRADLQRDLSISLERMATVQPARAAELFDAALAIWRRLHAAEPGVAYYTQAIALNRVQRVQQAPDATAPAALAEARHRLRALRDRKALEARLAPLLDELDSRDLPPWPG